MICYLGLGPVALWTRMHCKKLPNLTPPKFAQIVAKAMFTSKVMFNKQDQKVTNYLGYCCKKM